LIVIVLDSRFDQSCHGSPRASDGARMSSDESPRPQTWGQRHAVTILTTTLLGLLALVMTVQVAC
jgi:hypothetical protein